MSDQKDSIAKTIGSIFWKGYDEISTTISSENKRRKKLDKNQVGTGFSKWEDKMIEKKKHSDL